MSKNIKSTLTYDEIVEILQEEVDEVEVDSTCKELDFNDSYQEKR